MATKTDPRAQPRGSADGTGEVTLALLREQFQRSFVPRSEDDTKIPMIIPKIVGAQMATARITGRENKVTEARRVTPGFMVNPRRQITP